MKCIILNISIKVENIIIQVLVCVHTSVGALPPICIGEMG